MTKPRRVCACGCGRLVDATNTDDHTRRYHKAQHLGLYTSHWRTVKAAVRQRSGGICELRLVGCTHTAVSTHLDPRLGGDHRNATPLDCTDTCAHCHGVVDAPRSATGGHEHPAMPRDGLPVASNGGWW